MASIIEAVEGEIIDLEQRAAHTYHAAYHAAMHDTPELEFWTSILWLYLCVLGPLFCLFWDFIVVPYKAGQGELIAPGAGEATKHRPLGYHIVRMVRKWRGRAGSKKKLTGV